MSSQGSRSSRRSTRLNTDDVPERNSSSLSKRSQVQTTPQRSSPRSNPARKTPERSSSALSKRSKISVPERSSPRTSSRNGPANSSQTNGNAPTTNQNNGSEMDSVAPSSQNSEVDRSINVNLMSDPINLNAPLHYGSSEVQSGVRSGSTNYRRRVDLNTDSKFVRQINVGGSTQGSELGREESQATNATEETGAHLVIWGTDVSIAHCKRRFREFLKCRTLKTNELEMDEITQAPPSDLLDAPRLDTPYYIQKLEEISAIEEPFLNVNCDHVLEFDADLFRQMVCYPQEVIPAFDMAVNEIFHEMFPDQNLPHQINVRPYNVKRVPKTNLRSLNPEDINQLITVSGMVIRCSNIIPEMNEAFFECAICNSTKVAPDDMEAGQTPYNVLLYACADLVDAVQPGDRVTVTGIYRATPVRLNPKQRNVKSVYRTHIDVVHFRKVDSKRLHDESKEFHFTNDRIDYLKMLSRKPDIYERLAHAIAPSIFGYDDMKKGVLLQLFGGSKKNDNARNNSKWRHFRSEINIIICGDPGTSKSQLLKFVHGLVPRGQYTSGKGSSAVGLTAYITKDSDTKQLVLQTGALVLSDGGICCIDEFDKMSDSTRSVLHEVMEQQTLSIAKAGIVCQLNARTSLLCAANPVESQWNSSKTIIENIQLPHTLLSRFDLIFLVVDPQQEEYDRRLAQHLVSLYHQTDGLDEEQEAVLPVDVLKDYIAYARNYVDPRLSEEAGELLVHEYVNMRQVGSGRGQITAYPRQLEALIRIAEAHAKMRLSEKVELHDVEEALRLHREAIKQAATDPTSGKIDVSILTTGTSTSKRETVSYLSEAIKSLLNKKAGSKERQVFPKQSIYDDIKTNAQVSQEMFDDALNQLAEEGYLNVSGKLIKLTH